MKITSSLLLAAALFAAPQAHAIWEPGRNDNKALECGGYTVYTDNYTTSYAAAWHKGNLVSDADYTLTNVRVEKDGKTVNLNKTEDADTSFFLGRPKGFGVFEGPGFRLNLKNTIDNWEIDLEKTDTGEKVKCYVPGDCC
jgi:hypothetical protein